jgi:hypothetical protein
VFKDYKGWDFSYPFFCMCCGGLICAHQWAFGRSCGECDCGRCTHTNNRNRDKTYSGPRVKSTNKGEYEIPESRFLDIVESARKEATPRAKTTKRPRTAL